MASASTSTDTPSAHSRSDTNAAGMPPVIPVAVSPEEPQDLRLYTRQGAEVTYRSLFPVLFVPLRPG